MSRLLFSFLVELFFVVLIDDTVRREKENPLVNLNYFQSRNGEIKRFQRFAGSSRATRKGFDIQVVLRSLLVNQP